jgi:O-antigen/teichoic acid export membrane protein
MAQIGIYSLGALLANRLWMIPDALKDILLSKLTNGRTVKEVAKVTRISFFITILFCITAVIFGKLIIWLLYGDEFSNAYFVTMVLLAGILGMVFYKMVYSYNVVNGYTNVI